MALTGNFLIFCLCENHYGVQCVFGVDEPWSTVFHKDMWPSIQKHVLSTKASSRGVEVALRLFANALTFFRKWKFFMVQILFENPLWKYREKNIVLVCVHYAHAGECATALLVTTFFAEMYFFPRASVLIYLWLWKDITHVKLLQSLVAKILNICESKREQVLVYMRDQWHASFAYLLEMLPYAIY